MQKRKQGNKRKAQPEPETPKEPQSKQGHDHDDEGQADGKAAGAPKRKTRVNKLLKGSGGASVSPPVAKSNTKVVKSPAAAKRRVLTPRKKSKKLNQAHEVLEFLRGKSDELPGLVIPTPETLHKQSLSSIYSCM